MKPKYEMVFAGVKKRVCAICGCASLIKHNKKYVCNVCNYVHEEE